MFIVFHHVIDELTIKIDQNKIKRNNQLIGDNWGI